MHSDFLETSTFTEVAKPKTDTRKSAGLSQTELAQRLGISQSRISAMELDPGSINVDQLLALLAALKHELLVQPKNGIAEEPDSAAPDW